MSLSRFNAMDTILNRSEYDVDYVTNGSEPISSFFGCNVFNEATMRDYLDEDTYLSVKAAIQSGDKLTREVADVVAVGMKEWAMSKGASHYTHWFQPLTGLTAEKHDSFFNILPDGKVIEELGGNELSQQEPDGSSFPGGGLRSTYEARGYTAWDPSSPAFIVEVGDGKTLCVPTIFVTYSGESLDYKLPLLKSQAYLEKASIPVCQMFDKNVTKVSCTLGWEQEYFLVDETYYNARPDLLLTGRTVIGASPAKGQELDDHYFGSIPDRVYAFMRDLETECHKLAIPVRTRHNEVGPGQYELAPMFETCNIAVDHNQLLMSLMDKISRRHKLRVLLHEKPFAGVNGSGKHNNWSMSTNTGKNLLSPGKEPGKNLQFLTFLVNVIKSVSNHSDLIRGIIASVTNDHRLGANEAPPAIISVFLGETLTKVLNAIKDKGDDNVSAVKEALDLLSSVPDLLKDNTDRNRTSPFAFTGNKFEIRAVGSSANCAGPMTVMNTIMAQQLELFVKDVEAKKADGRSQDAAILSVLRTYIKETENIRFEGDNYSDDWKEEAAKRGLSNFLDTPEALDVFSQEQTIKLYTEGGIYTERELKAFHEVMLENYIMKLSIEAKAQLELANNYVFPAGAEYLTKIAETVASSKAAGLEEAVLQGPLKRANELASLLTSLKSAIEKLQAAVDGSHKDSAKETAVYLAQTIKPLMEEVRTYSDELELIVEDSLWPLPKYREMMFIK